ncbi:uncharacterized protein LOC132803523 [Ziziphus jujuba]|uniref:Uncharacterized protein LOC132803523 n=1 Tax=Ziziphus jujuba TaxID=326968 RepID=A0ABM4A7J9_ZIZJJ|nr:uncharacterized protein LOC132803523 [Ziziphus jujuba]
MLFYLTTLGLARFLIEDEPPSDEKSDKKTLMAVDAWKNSDYLCRNYILNGLSDAMYGVYCGMKSAKEPWETLDGKYKTENTAPKRMFINETFQVAAMIKKLPPSWGDFRNYLKHKRNEMDMEALIGKIRIEDDNRRSDRRFMKAGIKANIIKHGSSSKNKKKPGKSFKLRPKEGISKKAKFQGKCFNCHKMGHRAADCRLPKRKRNIETTMMEHITREVDEIDLSAVVSEVNLVGSNPRKWWIGTGATSTCVQIEACSPPSNQRQMKKLFMGNSAYSKIQREGKIVLKMTFGKDLTLNNSFPNMNFLILNEGRQEQHGFDSRVHNNLREVDGVDKRCPRMEEEAIRESML